MKVTDVIQDTISEQDAVERKEAEAIDLHRRFATFQQHYPLRHRVLNGVRWSYIDTDQGDEVVVLLPGALGVADTAFRYVLAFAPRYRVLSLDYPSALHAAEPLLAGIAALLDVERCGAVHLVGGSYSGPVAHAFAQRYPACVRSLAFSNTGLPERRRISMLVMFITLYTLLPAALRQASMRWSLGRWLLGADAEEQFLRDYFSRQLPLYDRQFLRSRAAVLLDLCAAEEGSIESLHTIGRYRWRGPVLLVDACDDRVFTEVERRRLQMHYPQAARLLINITGHGSALKAFADHVLAYERFWKEQCG